VEQHHRCSTFFKSFEERYASSTWMIVVVRGARLSQKQPDFKRLRSAVSARILLGWRFVDWLPIASDAVSR